MTPVNQIDEEKKEEINKGKEETGGLLGNSLEAIKRRTINKIQTDSAKNKKRKSGTCGLLMAKTKRQRNFINFRN